MRDLFIKVGFSRDHSFIVIPGCRLGMLSSHLKYCLDFTLDSPKYRFMILLYSPPTRSVLGVDGIPNTDLF